MEFILIHPDNLRAVWEDVRAGLDKMPPEDWIAEDVYHAIKAGQAALHLAVDDSGYRGFVILQRLLSEFSRKPRLHCWLAYNHGDEAVYDAAVEFMRHQAKEIGADKLTFGSPRNGWVRRFKCLTATYEIPLESSP